MIRGIVFDMDGLLFDSERLVKRTWNEVGEILGLPGLGEHVRHTLGKNRRGRNEYFIRTFGEDFPFEAFDRENKRIFAGIMEQEGMPVKPGARELLAYGRKQGYKIGIATSSSRNYAVHSKPDPEIYLAACESLGLKPGECMALEDSPAGIRSASSAGMVPVMVPDLVEPTEEIRELAYAVCDSLAEVEGLLELL